MDRRGKQGEEYLDAPPGDPQSNPDSRARTTSGCVSVIPARWQSMMRRTRCWSWRFGLAVASGVEWAEAQTEATRLRYPLGNNIAFYAMTYW